MCIYLDILLYDVLYLLCPYSRPSTLINASMYISTTDAAVEEACSFYVPHNKYVSHLINSS
jgi:hypothetical protein